MVDLINAVYTDLQQLQLQPTKHNIVILSRCLANLEELARKIGNGEPEAPEDAEETEEDGHV
jgi:hypothetical protein